MKTYRMMAVFANDRYRFCGCNPGITHGRIFLSSCNRRTAVINEIVKVVPVWTIVFIFFLFWHCPVLMKRREVEGTKVRDKQNARKLRSQRCTLNALSYEKQHL
jgi:hypothetical protein